MTYINHSLAGFEPQGTGVACLQKESSINSGTLLPLLQILVPADGFEPPTLCSEDRCSNPLSYAGKLLSSYYSKFHLCLILYTDAPVAQLDRALVSGTKGRGFESLQAHHLFYWFFSFMHDMFYLWPEHQIG